jgi:predicted nuclease with RNAse H fold
VRYCGIVASEAHLTLCALEEVRAEEPPIRLSALFFEPGAAPEVAAQARAFAAAEGGGVVVAIAAALTDPGHGRPMRVCDEELRRRGVAPERPSEGVRELAGELSGLDRFTGSAGALEGRVPEGAFSSAPVFETNADGVFCALQGRRVPARRHPIGVQRRIDELEQDRVLDDGGGLWNRRIEEIEAAATALCAHRYAVGHACWLGDPEEGVVVLPGSAVPDSFETRGVMAPVERVRLPERP